MSDEGVLDPLDRQIAAALQLNGRAAWRDIALAVDSTETTVARRAQRLIDSGVVRVTLSRTPACSGMAQVATVFIRCAPGTSRQVAATIAERAEVWSTGIYAGDADVICQVTVPSGDALAGILLGELQRIPGVVSSVAEPMTRTFKVSYAWARHLLDERAAELDVLPVSHQNDGHLLSESDEVIIGALRLNARRSFAAVAAELGTNESTVRRRFEALRRQGCVNVATFVRPRAMGFQQPMLMKLVLAPGKLESAAAQLTGYAGVRYMAAGLGRLGLLVELNLATATDVYDFTTTVLGRIDGISEVHIWTELVALKRAYVRLDDDAAATRPVAPGDRPMSLARP
jgi:DNA-binding Lrp family transcriptional regulator